YLNGVPVAGVRNTGIERNVFGLEPLQVVRAVFSGPPCAAPVRLTTMANAVERDPHHERWFWWVQQYAQSIGPTGILRRRTRWPEHDLIRCSKPGDASKAQGFRAEHAC